MLTWSCCSARRRTDIFRSSTNMPARPCCHAKYSWGNGRFAIELAPAYEMSFGSRGNGLCQDIIEKLPITKPLQNEPPKKLPVLPLLKQERDDGRSQVDGDEERIIEA